ncbi:hypothetical protein FQN57_004516 [Myotisia sp. PD_48]|nr:hypothetical protein FQN57_004516 [Myotisia sp. PD_48]
MASTTVVQSKGIYHGLPTFPESMKGLSAIITGANGISGDHMLRVLSESPQRWSNIYTMSRRAPDVDRQLKTKVQHISLDFLNSSPQELANSMKENGVKADYVFFFSYVQVEPKEGDTLWSDDIGMTKVNVALLSNLLEALKLANITPKRFLLQTGAKNYGVHLGPTTVPQHESDPRVLLDSNFYYPQEDALAKYCKETGAEWSVTMPSYIVGAVKNAAMNVAYPLGVYAAVQAHLGKPLVYPGDLKSSQMPIDLSSAMMNAYLAEWAVLTPKAANQKFNASDNSPWTFGKFWPTLASWYEVSYEQPDEKSEYTSFPSRHVPRGYGPAGTTSFKYLLSYWAKDPQVQNAWKELSQKHGIHMNPFSSEKEIDRIFSFTDFALVGAWPVYFNLDKGHKLGWFGTVDSGESIRKTLEEFVNLRMLPPIPN